MWTTGRGSHEELRTNIADFVWSLQTDRVGEFRTSPGGKITLYSSCFAVMTLHYLGQLDNLADEQRRSWADYILSWQNPTDGYFIGPELVRDQITSQEHNWDVVRMHLTAHVLPALDILRVVPSYSLTFAHPFLEVAYLQAWLAARDWGNAWLEGNNLIFVVQFLHHLRDIEQIQSAQVAIDLFFQ